METQAQWLKNRENHRKNMNPLTDKTFGKLVTEAASARHMDKINEVLEILDKINTIVEGSPKPPYPEIYKLSGDAILICKDWGV